MDIKKKLADRLTGLSKDFLNLQFKNMPSGSGDPRRSG